MKSKTIIKHDPKKIMKILYPIFFFIYLLSVIYSCNLQINYQDSWILEQIWLLILLLVVIYLAIVILETDLEKIALLSSFFVFIIYFLPSIKYEFQYGTTSDVAYHVTLAREISSGYFNPNETYSGYFFMAVVGIFFWRRNKVIGLRSNGHEV